MGVDTFQVEAETLFSESLIWRFNQDFYKDKGISAWSEDIVPHHMTSNAMVGKTYAELILGFLKDLSSQGKTHETVYLVELGAGHGRLAFHILKALENRIESLEETIPDYCFILSDIVEENLTFFQEHPQFQTYIRQGVLDVSYFDASKSQELYLRNAQKRIVPQMLKQPILVIGNYFFDSIPTQLYQIQNEKLFTCSVSIESTLNPDKVSREELMEKMDFSYHRSLTDKSLIEEPIFKEILEDYNKALLDTYLFFPQKAMECIHQLKSLSKAGLVLLTMDKGFHEIHNLKNKKEPEIISHGSFSIWVNYHAISAFCEKLGGKAFFPKYSNFHLEIGCLLFLENSESYSNTNFAYQQFVNEFGPDDFNSLKQLSYFNMSRLKTNELIALFRLSGYDSTFFIKLFPQFKQSAKTITYNERNRIGQTLDQVWEMYFHIHEQFDLPYEIGGMMYDLGFFARAFNYFQHSRQLFGLKPDIYYNQALCLYQLRKDDLFRQLVSEAKQTFPDYQLFGKLDQLDMA